MPVPGARKGAVDADPEDTRADNDKLTAVACDALIRRFT
jgi:hypothetical protein